MPGIAASRAEVVHLNRYGFIVDAAGEELWLGFEDFPWFWKASVEDICSVELPFEGHLHWPTLDIDLEVESIRNPGDFPLLAE